MAECEWVESVVGFESEKPRSQVQISANINHSLHALIGVYPITKMGTNLLVITEADLIPHVISWDDLSQIQTQKDLDKEMGSTEW